MIKKHLEDPITEKLDNFFKDNMFDKEEDNNLLLNSSENLHQIECLIEEFENLKDDTPTEDESEEKTILPINQKENKRQKLRQIFALLIQEKEEISEFIFQRLITISLNAKTIIELVQMFTEREKDELIIHLLSNLCICACGDYEDCLFVVADYATKNVHKFQLIFGLLQMSVQNKIYSLYPLFSLCLKKFAKFSKLDESMMLIKYMVYYQIEVSTFALNYLVENLCRQNRIEEAQSLFNKFLTYEATNVFPEEVLRLCKFSKIVISSGVSIITYGTLIKCLCKANLMELALYYFEILKKENLLKDEVIFNILIDGCSKTQNIEQLKTIYYDMLSLSITPTIVTFNTIIDAFIRYKDLPAAWKIFEDLLNNKIKPDNFTFSTLFRGIRQYGHKEYLQKSFKILEDLKSAEEDIDIILINVLLDSCIAMKEGKYVVELFEKVKSGYYTPIVPDIITFNTFIKGCAQMNLFGRAQDAYEYMFTLRHVKPNDVTFNSMIDVCVRNDNMPQVWGIIEKMKENGIFPDNFTYSTIIKGLNKNTNLNIVDFNGNNSNENREYAEEEKSASELDLAFKLFENVKNHSKPDEILYNCIMDACLRFDKIDKMMALYDEMIFANIKPSSITCGIIIKAYGMKGKISKALEVYKEMKRENIEISSITYGCLINACIKNDNLEKAFELYEELGENKIQMNIVLYTTLIKAYSKTKNLQKVLEIFNKMKRDKLNSPNNVTYNSVIDCCIKCDENKLSENIFEEMKISGIKPDIVTFSTLIKGCLKKSELNKAIEYINSMQKNEVRPDEVLLNSVLDGCEKMKKYNKAVEIFYYIRGFNVEPTMMSYSIMMKVYGKLNDFQSSKALMDEVKKKNKNISLIIFTCYMKTCFVSGNHDEAISIYNQLDKFKLVPDSITYFTMINGLVNVTQKNKQIQSNINGLLLDLIKGSLSKNIMMNAYCYSDVLKKFKSSDDSGLANEMMEMLNEHDIEVNSNGKGKYWKNNQSSSNKGDNFYYLFDGYKHKNNQNNTTNKIVQFSKIEGRENSDSKQTPLRQIGRIEISEKGRYLDSLGSSSTTNNYASTKADKKFNFESNSVQNKGDFGQKTFYETKTFSQQKGNFYNSNAEKRTNFQLPVNSTTSLDVFSSLRNEIKTDKNKKFNRF